MIILEEKNMYNNITKNHAIDYNPKIISKIREMINEGFYKLKTFVKVKNQSQIKIYEELEDKFEEITLKLEKYEIFNEELDYFLLISEKILYIIHNNCKDSSFGYCDFALELFDFFMDIWNKKIKLINDYSSFRVKEYQNCRDMFKRKYFEYNKKFCMEIYDSDNDFSKEKFYRIMDSMRQ